MFGVRVKDPSWAAMRCYVIVYDVFSLRNDRRLV